jgi:DNA-binding NtrC family response regulator
MRILVVDDNRDSLQSLCLVLKDLGHEPRGVEGPLDALAAACKEFFPLIITDIRMPGMGGLELLTRFKADPQCAACDVVLITGHGDMSTAVDALRKGAYDYLNKPINARELAAVVDRCAEHQSLLIENRELHTTMEQRVSEAAAGVRRDLEDARRVLREVTGIGTVIAESEVMTTLLHEALILHAEPSVSVLIEGETGTGKEVLARYIHNGDGVNDAPFMAINCAAIPHELFESELFGHEAGAFTGSRAEGAPGKLEQAGRGTLFLDEVAEMPLSLQPKLLRVLEERSFYRVGGVKKRSFAARVVCAGNRNMTEMVKKGSFRRDLYHRLRVGHLRIPPLRGRPEDIRALAEFFLLRESRKRKKHFKGPAPEALETLLHYPWPGNVRELENAMERAVLMHDGELLLPAHIGFLYQGAGEQADDSAHVAGEPYSGQTSPAGFGQNPDAAAQADSLPAPVRAAETTVSFDAGGRFHVTLPDEPVKLDDLLDAVVHVVVDRFAGNKSKAADYLGISRFALHRRMQAREKR